MGKKIDSKTFSQQKRHRRQWITFVRMCRYGVNNFSRNAWLTIAATAVMTITLLIIFVTLAARNVLVDTVAEISSKVDMSIYVQTDITSKDIQTVKLGLEKLTSVKHVAYVSPSQARADFAQKSKGSASTLEALNEATNKFPGIFRISLFDINKTEQLRHFVDTDKTFKANIDPTHAPSFAGDRRSAIENIGRGISFAEKAGLVASIVFVVISSLIVFNTIRMAIFNRKDEIQMMKLIGAERSFIRGPFVVEAIVYGCIAAVLATALSMVLLYASSEKLLIYGIVVGGTINFVTIYIGLVLLAMLALGSVIGVVSSLLATRRYLQL